MIPEFLLTALLFAAAPDDSPKASDDATLERYRTPFDTLTERTIGSASRAVRYDWRKSKVAVGIEGSNLLEFNNFTSGRFGAFVRTPLGGLMGEVGAYFVDTEGTASTRKLSLTPYRQTGRPSRLEVDINLGYPLAEGVVTPRPQFIPAAELVLSVMAGMRYRYYPGELAGSSFGDVVKSVIAPSLSKKELANLEAHRLPGMQIDEGRYDLLAGMTLDVYFQSGFFFTPRVMLGLPLFSGFGTARIGVYWELSLGVGWSF